MSVWDKLRGTIETIFQIGLDGLNLKTNNNILEVRNSDDTALARIKAANPIDDFDVVNVISLPIVLDKIVVSKHTDIFSTAPSNEYLPAVLPEYPLIVISNDGNVVSAI
jgi:hypothetical protein